MPAQRLEFPSSGVDPAYRQFLESFYALSDVFGSHKEYADQFTDQATIVMASKQAVGRNEILKLRESMWEKVASRHHVPRKVFPFTPSSDEVMLYGSVDYVLKDGTEVKDVEWAARAQFHKENEVVKMSYYQVYLDTNAQTASK